MQQHQSQELARNNVLSNKQCVGLHPIFRFNLPQFLCARLITEYENFFACISISHCNTIKKAGSHDPASFLWYEQCNQHEDFSPKY